MEVALKRKRRVISRAPEEFRLADLKFFKCLTTEELAQLELNANREFFKKRSVVYREGTKHSGVYCIIKGIVKIYKIGANGKQQILRFAQKGDIIGYRSLITNELACTSAKAYEDTVVAYIPNRILMTLLEENWRFTQGIMQMMCKELGDSNNFVTDIAQKSVRERTAEMLLYLKDEFGVDHNGVLQISITREDLANMVGTVTETLIRVMSEFRNEQLLDLTGRKILFVNVSMLSAIANLNVQPTYV